MNLPAWRALPLWVKILLFPWVVSATIGSIAITLTALVAITSAVVAAYKTATRRLKHTSKVAVMGQRA